eukprot:g5135.t1
MAAYQNRNHRQQLQTRELPELTLTLNDFIPKPTPRNITYGSLWIIGLAFMFMLPALVPASVKSMNVYDEKMLEAQSVDITDAQERYLQQRHRYESMRGWWFQSETRREEHARLEYEKAQRRLDHLLHERKQIQREGKQAVGIWSEFGMEETRNAFWKNFYAGIGFAKDVTKNQAFWSLMFSGFGGGRRDEGMLEVIFRWVWKIMMNFTIGLCGACFGFIWNLWDIIDGYGTNFASGFSFFLLASLGALSVTITVVGGLWGGAGVGVYFAAKQAINHARLQNEQRRRYIQQQGRRPHYQ